MSYPNNTHETQPETERAVDETYKDMNMDGIQRVEGGGPIRKVNMREMPKPIRYFGYTVATIFLLGTLILLLSDWLS
ncbi:hypothetical protein [Paenibacillus agaridevorans]|uniref:hypothetical protein n=1 Tax=Paenibacillus agaridevorans TaxID=171404 RepID=UPI001BE3D4F7|nr:hypothetical protein [Paenibacillus agaridevorans]